MCQIWCPPCLSPCMVLFFYYVTTFLPFQGDMSAAGAAYLPGHQTCALTVSRVCCLCLACERSQWVHQMSVTTVASSSTRVFARSVVFQRKFRCACCVCRPLQTSGCWCMHLSCISCWFSMCRRALLCSARCHLQQVDEQRRNRGLHSALLLRSMCGNVIMS